MKKGKVKKLPGMSMGKTIMLLAIALIAVSLGFLAHMGVFNVLTVTEEEIGPCTYVYESFAGDYAKTGPVFEKLYKSLLADGAPASKGIGIYYDDPKKTAKDDLRSDCGAVIFENDLVKLPKLLEKYTARTLSAKVRPTVEFPYRNGLSFMIGPMKAYPALTKYVVKKGYKVKSAIEIYDMDGGKIIYAMDVE